MVALSIGGFNRILIDFLVGFSVDFSVRVSLDCLSVGFRLVRRTWLLDTDISTVESVN